MEGREEGSLVRGVERDDGGCAWIRAKLVVDGEETASVLNVLEVLVVECELRGVIVEDCDIEHIYSTCCPELSAIDDTVWGSWTIKLQTILDVFTVSYSESVSTCKQK